MKRATEKRWNKEVDGGAERLELQTVYLQAVDLMMTSSRIEVDLRLPVSTVDKSVASLELLHCHVAGYVTSSIISVIYLHHCSLH